VQCMHCLRTKTALRLLPVRGPVSTTMVGVRGRFPFLLEHRHRWRRKRPAWAGSTLRCTPPRRRGQPITWSCRGEPVELNPSFGVLRGLRGLRGPGDLAPPRAGCRRQPRDLPGSSVLSMAISHSSRGIRRQLRHESAVARSPPLPLPVPVSILRTGISDRHHNNNPVSNLQPPECDSSALSRWS